MSDRSYIASVVTAYWVVSISMVYLNKFLLSNEEASIPAPYFVTWFQCIVTVSVCKFLGNMGELSRKNSDRSSFFTQFPKVEYNVHGAAQVAPLSIIFVGMIATNQICLQMVEVSFYNVARSLSIVFNVIFTFTILGNTTSFATCATLLVVILGFLIGVDGELNFSLYGTIFGVCSSVFVSLNGIFTAKVLPKVDNDKNKLMYYNNYNASMLFIPLILYFESGIIYEHAAKLTSLFFWFAMCITGVTGFLIGLVTVMQVKATSPLAHNISGTAKAGVQSLMAFYIWGNQPTTKGILGIILVLAGSAWYAYVQMNQPKAKVQETNRDRDREPLIKKESSNV